MKKKLLAIGIFAPVLASGNEPFRRFTLPAKTLWRLLASGSEKVLLVVPHDFLREVLSDRTLIEVEIPDASFFLSR